MKYNIQSSNKNNLDELLIKHSIKVNNKIKLNELSIVDIFTLLNHFTTYCKKRIEIYKDMNKKQRQPNFPEDISENIVRFIIEKLEKINVSWNTTSGDLMIINTKEKIEVKCFSSTGPTSFGPTEKWDYLYFLDAIDFINMNFKCYKISLSNDNDIWKNIKINKKETFNEQCVQGRRPRIQYSSLKSLIPIEYITEIFNGNLKILLE